jgi:tRNA-2-methylthio-N6-dimethylallyladenosine synthase
MTKRYFIETFGCQMNELDSEKIAGNLQHCGMEPASDPSQADVIILNTCSVRERAVQKVYARLGEIRRHKEHRKDLIVGVAGCMAQLESDKILHKAPFINIVAGPRKGHEMSGLIEQSLKLQTPIKSLRKDEDPDPPENEYTLRENRWSANVAISEGCNRRCSFCVVPMARGRKRDRPSSYIIREIDNLIACGYIEILLLGQTVNSYRDRTVENMNFPALLRRVAGIEGIKRVRFTSPHPADFSDELLQVMISCPQICNQIHLPVQSGSDRVLQSMRRGYTRNKYLEVIEKIKAAPRPISVSTDIIVGFPGETETDFEDTIRLLDEVKYDNVFSFKYSARSGTEALNLPNEIDEVEKGKRLKILQEHQKQIQLSNNQEYLGRVMEILVDAEARSRFNLSGRTSNNKIVNFNGPESLMGQIIQVEITGFGANSLKGVIETQ